MGPQLHSTYRHIKKRVVLGSWELAAGASEAARSPKNITATAPAAAVAVPAAASAVANKAAKAATTSTRNSSES